MAIGFHDIDGKTYYFYSKTGDKVEGWLTMKSTGKKYYLNPDNGGVLVKNTEMEIDGVVYIFDKEGAAVIKTVGRSLQERELLRIIWQARFSR